MSDSQRTPLEKKLLRVALFYVNKWLSTEKQIRDYLKKKIVQLQNESMAIEPQNAHQLIEAIILKLKEQGLIQDALILKGSVSTYLKKGLSTSAITYKLKQKGFTSSQIVHELQETGEDFELKSLLALMKKKKVGSFACPPTRNLLPKERAYFFRKGFSSSLIQKALLLTQEEITDL